MYVGEKMSGVFNEETAIYEPNGEIYADQYDRLIGRPLDTGRLLYAKLRRTLADSIAVEVWWNHFTDEITAQIAGRQSDYHVLFRDMQMARTDKVVFIDQIVARLKELEPSLLQ